MIARRFMLVLLSLMLFAGLAILPACGGAEEPAPVEPAPVEEEEEVKAPAIDEVAEILRLSDEYLSSEFSQNWVVNPADLNTLLFEENDDSFQIVDVRSPEYYAAGHIEGAINIPYDTIVDEDQLAKLDKDKTQLLVDYDGSKSTGVVLVYSQLDFDAMFLRFGMSGWNNDPALLGGEPFDGVGADYPVTQEGYTAEPQFDLPVLDSGAADAREAVINATKAFLARGGNSNLISADELNALVQAGGDDYLIIQATTPEHYEIAHIEGAIAMGRPALPKVDNIRKIDFDKKIVLTCYQGHNSGLMQMLLGQLGYDVWALHYGMSSWTNNAEFRAAVPTYNPANVKNFPVVK